MAGGIFGLDLSSHTGWGYAEEGARPDWGVWELPRIGGEAARFVALENECEAVFERLQPHHLVIEAPLSLWAQSDSDTVNQQRGLRACAIASAYRCSVSYSEVDALSVRDELLGVRAKKGESKPAVLAYWRRRGLEVYDHNAADALMLVEWYCRRIQWKIAA